MSERSHHRGKGEARGEALAAALGVPGCTGAAVLSIERARVSVRQGKDGSVAEAAATLLADLNREVDIEMRLTERHAFLLVVAVRVDDQIVALACDGLPDMRAEKLALSEARLVAIRLARRTTEVGGAS